MLKKVVLTFAAAAAILSACSSNQTDLSNNAAEKQPSDQTSAVQENNPPAAENTNEHANENVNDEWSSLPEYATIIQHIDSSDYTFKTVTDNQNKRILLLTNKDGIEQYKSIFIKETNRLKIIQFDDEGEIFNAVLESK